MDGRTAPWWQPLAAAARRNLVPGLALQAIALALVLAYYLAPATRPAFDAVARLKLDGGYLFAAIATAIAAGLVPWLIEAARGDIPRRLLAVDLTYVLGVWAWRGAEVDAFYRFQGWLFGTGTDAATIACKVALDMLVYAPLWAQPILVACFRLREHGYRFAEFRAAWRWRPFVHQVFIVQASGWVVWVPTVCIVYSLPAPLQFPLFAVMVCFWSLLLATLVERETKREAMNDER